MLSIDILIDEFTTSNRDERLGQYFCNRYMKQAWPELYYTDSFTEAKRLIIEWLDNHHYYDTLPPNDEETES